MITVQSTKTSTIRVTHRHPDILKLKRAFIEQNKGLFSEIFVTIWKGVIPRQSRDGRIFYSTSMRGTMTPFKHLWPQKAITLGEILREDFGYNPASSPQSVMWHFRRLYRDLYPTEIK